MLVGVQFVYTPILDFPQQQCRIRLERQVAVLGKVLELPEKLAEVLDELQLSEEEIKKLNSKTLEAAVLELVRQRKLSPGRGAELLDMYLGDFVELMADHKIPYFTEPPRDAEELAALTRKYQE